MKALSVAIVFISLISGPSRSPAQGVIDGYVLDSLTAQQLKGAEITLAGTALSVVSNTNGEFRIAGVPPGEYMLHASYLGYKEKDCLINVEQGKVLKFNIKLVPIITVKSKTVLTQQVMDQAQDINQQVSSNIIEDVVSGEQLQDMRDENIPVTLSRLPGVSIMYNSVTVPSAILGGSILGGISSSMPTGYYTLSQDPVPRILIRGMDARYYNVTIDGVRIPPASAIEKSIDLNTISGSDFQNIEVRKTITSDQDADATAGAINLVAEKAPYKRTIKVEALGNYNALDKSDKQYNFTGAYGERFFDNVFGIRVDAHTEKRIMSNESQMSPDYFYYLNYSYTNAVRHRNDANILLDVTTPDGGSITFHNMLNRTNTDDFKSEADSGISGYPAVNFSDGETDRAIFLSSFAGSNHLLGFDVDWNAAFTESRDNRPYDYSLDFVRYFNVYTGRPLSHYDLDHTLGILTKNYSKEKAVSLDFHRRYALSDEITGEVKFGGKYRINSSSYFEASHLGISQSHPWLSSFQDSPPGELIGLGNYSIPLINEDVLRSLRQSAFSVYDSSARADINSNNLSESVSAGYIMHTLNFRQLAIFIMGVRIENERNDYSGYYFPTTILQQDPNISSKSSQVVLYNSLPEQTRMFHYNKATILPNFQMILKPTGFMNLRMAAYKTLIRPPYIARMPRYFAISGGTDRYLYYLNMGNPDLENADAWNYEFQLQFHGNGIGEFTLDAFYKDIEGMVRATNGIQLLDSTDVTSFGIDWRNYVGQFPPTLGTTANGLFSLFSYYNSSKPTRIWGFEVSHRADFRYLPGLLKNIVLNYNITFLRSESWTTYLGGIITTTLYAGRKRTVTTQSQLIDKEQKLSNMPDFFANVNLGYDISGFSFRISYFYRDEYPMYDYPWNINNPYLVARVKRSRYSRLDVAVREQILRHISFILRLNNITNSKEEALIQDPPSSYQSRESWETAQAFIYGFNLDFGIGIHL